MSEALNPHSDGGGRGVAGASLDARALSLGELPGVGAPPPSAGHHPADEETLT